LNCHWNENYRQSTGNSDYANKAHMFLIVVFNQ
jgi:hypothetical protein